MRRAGGSSRGAHRLEGDQAVMEPYADVEMHSQVVSYPETHLRADAESMRFRGGDHHGPQARGLGVRVEVDYLSVDYLCCGAIIIIAILSCIYPPPIEDSPLD